MPIIKTQSFKNRFFFRCEFVSLSLLSFLLSKSVLSDVNPNDFMQRGFDFDSGVSKGQTILIWGYAGRRPQVKGIFHLRFYFLSNQWKISIKSCIQQITFHFLFSIVALLFLFFSCSIYFLSGCLLISTSFSLSLFSIAVFLLIFLFSIAVSYFYFSISFPNCGLFILLRLNLKS